MSWCGSGISVGLADAAAATPQDRADDRQLVEAIGSEVPIAATCAAHAQGFGVCRRWQAGPSDASDRSTMTLPKLNPKDVVLVRHGETTWSRSGQHTGLTDIPLTDAGEAEAKLLAPLLATEPFARVLVSPLQRARRTCELAGLGDQAVVDADLVEWNYGAFEGLTTEEIHHRAPGWQVFAHGCPEGESPQQVAERVDRVLARLRADDPQGPAILFAHGHFLRMVAARWLELPPQEGARFLLDTATLNVLSHYRGVAALKCWNAQVAP